jgi:uncharacterized protein YsxB (DUF464 family)
LTAAAAAAFAASAAAHALYAAADYQAAAAAAAAAASNCVSWLASLCRQAVSLQQLQQQLAALQPRQLQQLHPAAPLHTGLSAAAASLQVTAACCC